MIEVYSKNEEKLAITVVNAVKCTNDYNLFRLLNGNRDINENHVRKLELSILANNRLKEHPIHVNQNMQIIDGQHRFEVCKRNDLPVYYIVGEGKLKDVIPLQISKNWTLKDFVQSFVKQQKQPYVVFQEFLNKYPKLNISVASKLFCHQKSIGQVKISSTEIFKSGQMTLNKYSKAIDIANAVYRIDDLTNSQYRWIFSAQFVGAVKIIFEQPTFEKDVFYHKLSLNIQKLIRKPTTNDYVDLLLEIYNCKNRSPLNIKGYKQY